MFPLRRPFESEKLQLQELNQKLGQYLSRAKLLEQENARLVTELNRMRSSRPAARDTPHMAELREMRRLVEHLSLEKCKAEMERETLRKELQEVQAMRSDESAMSRSLDGELKMCERELHHAHQNNAALEERLVQMENEYVCLEDVHRREMEHLRSQVHARVSPALTQTPHVLPAVTMEEIQEYAHHLSESWTDMFEMYRQRVEEIEESIRGDQVRLEDIRREKMEFAAELNRLQAEIEKQTKLQMDLEEQLINMQENFRGDISRYQMIIEELEHERMLLANTISEKLKDHQDLLQVKMGLGLEVAAYRALLEGEAQMRSDQQSRERIIDIKLSAHPPLPRASTFTSTRPEVRPHLTGYDVRFLEPISTVRTSTLSSQINSHGVSRIVPITKSSRAQQSPAARRDMVSFTKAKQEAVAASTTKPRISASERTKDIVEEKSVRIKETAQAEKIKDIVEEKSVKIKETAQAERTKDIVGEKSVKITEMSQGAPKSPPVRPQSGTAYKPMGSVKVVTPPMMSLSKTEESYQKVADKEKERKDDIIETDNVVVTEEPGERHFAQQEEFKPKRDLKESENVGPKVFSGEEKILDSVSMDELIEKVMKPAGLDPKLISSGDSKITYHVEKTEQEDGSTKTQIVLQSKVEEDVDISDNSALEELLSKGVKKVSLEDIEGTPAGSMIQNLLSLGLQGESLGNKSVNVEIIEEPVESQSDEEGEVEIEETVELKSKPYVKPSSMFFQIEEPENEPPLTRQDESTDETVNASGYSRSGSVQVQEVSRDESLPYYSQVQETQEYFVSTPEDNMSESEEGGGFMSYGHYGAVDDLSDERYYQEEGLPANRRYSDEGDSNRESPDYVQRDSFPQCIIEEEVHVSPTVQESMLEILKEESLDPREQLMGALEHLEGTVSGAVKEELALFTKAGDVSDNISVNIKKVEEDSDNRTMTFVAELNVSQSLDESGLLGDQADDLSQEQLMAALKSSSPELHQALSSGGYTVKVSQEEVQIPWMSNIEEMESTSSGPEENVIRLGPNEGSFTFQMDHNSSSSASASGQQAETLDSQSGDGGNVQEFLQTQMIDPSLKVCHEKRVATVYLESTKED